MVTFLLYVNIISHGLWFKIELYVFMHENKKLMPAQLDSD